jgi:hypothetical protein
VRKTSAAVCLLILIVPAGGSTSKTFAEDGLPVGGRSTAQPAFTLSDGTATTPPQEAAVEGHLPVPPVEGQFHAGEVVRFPVPRSLGPVCCIAARQRGPEGIPAMLPGVWHVTLCFESGHVAARHCWLRYQNVHTGEVHTLARFVKGKGGWMDENGDWIAPPAEESGLVWDHDLKRECDVLKGRVHMISVVRTNPCIYRGWDDGYGHGRIINNCATWCRDAWEYHTGERAELMLLAHTTGKLHTSLNRCHPGLVLPGRVIMVP